MHYSLLDSIIVTKLQLRLSLWCKRINLLLVTIRYFRRLIIIILELRSLFVRFELHIENVSGREVIENEMLQDIIVEINLVLEVSRKVRTTHWELLLEVPKWDLWEMLLNVMRENQLQFFGFQCKSLSRVVEEFVDLCVTI